jgi:hypothetical protein
MKDDQQCKAETEDNEGNHEVAVGKDSSGGAKKRHPIPVEFQAINRRQHTERAAAVSTLWTLLRLQTAKAADDQLP